MLLKVRKVIVIVSDVLPKHVADKNKFFQDFSKMLGQVDLLPFFLQPILQ